MVTATMLWNQVSDSSWIRMAWFSSRTKITRADCVYQQIRGILFYKRHTKIHWSQRMQVLSACGNC